MYHLIYDQHETNQDFCLMFETSDGYFDTICEWSEKPSDFLFLNIGDDSSGYTLVDYLDCSKDDSLDFILLTSFNTCPTISDIISYLLINHPELLL